MTRITADDRVRRARGCAQALLHRSGVRAPEHVTVEAFAKWLGATIIEAPLAGAKAQLVRIGDTAQIVLSDRVTDLGARRFSIAHELGHLALRHAPPKLSGRAMCVDHDDEVEANAFAAELLMPEALVRKQCEVSPVSLDDARAIAERFRVSIVASAIRFVELASERCAAVMSEQGRVKWIARSATFTREIKRGTRLDAQTVAYDYFARGALDERAQAVPANAWLDTSAENDIVEHSVAWPELGTVLTMLWVPERSAPRLAM